MEKIEYIVAKDGLKKQCRKREKVFKRMFIYNLMRDHDIQVTKIGRYFGRNHASVINGLKTYNDLMSTNNGQFLTILSNYMKTFDQFDVKKMKFSLRNDLNNATTHRDLTIMRKRMENNLYMDLIENDNGGK
jgi:hypothetical protein